jgi:hypothetical protein
LLALFLSKDFFKFTINENEIEQIIVLTTGSFVPFHQGHLCMVEK